MIHIFSSSLFLAFLEGGDGWMDAKGKIYIFLFFSFTFGHMEIYNRRLFVSFNFIFPTILYKRGVVVFS
jgi:hypothetical protein